MALYYHLLLLLCSLSVLCSADARLSLDYYAKSCPNAESIVRDAVIDKQLSHPTTAAGTLRLFFHDCFVGGCDASVLLSPTPLSPLPERLADINLSLPGDAFDAVVRAKARLELACPLTVSCADVLALAARDLLSLLGGPHFPLPLGRLDSLSSPHPSLVPLSIPLPNASLPSILRQFSAKRFSLREAVALSGAHTVGFSHCKEFAARIYGPSSPDPSLNPRFAQGLRNACRNYTADPTVSVFNDVMTPSKFDNVYYVNLERGLGLLASDQALMGDARTAAVVREYAANETAFFADFAAAMRKLSVYGVKTGQQGEVRRRCEVTNGFGF